MDPTWMVMGQAAGVAAALSVKLRQPVADVPVGLVQRELLKQKSQLMFYWDLPLNHPAFKAIQWLSVHEVVTGYPDRLFRPDQELTRAEMASLVVKGLDVWPSVSNAHFSDVPYDAWAFRDIETLYDNSALGPLGIEPLWPKFGSWDAQASRNVSYDQDLRFGPFLPDKTVTWTELAQVIYGVQRRQKHSPLQEVKLMPCLGWRT